jgi:hypothetical protein
MMVRQPVSGTATVEDEYFDVFGVDEERMQVLPLNV